jgi:hypothetical protein
MTPGGRLPAESEPEYNQNAIMSRTAYEDPVEQVMFILGLKHDPKFETTVHAILYGSTPGILDASEQLRVYVAVQANFHAWHKTIEKIQAEIGPDLPPLLRGQIYEIIVGELDEKHYGGRWFAVTRVPPEHWVNMGAYSPTFRRGENEVFCLPAPYFALLAGFFA